MTKNTPRIFISLLLILLCIGMLPVSAFASGGDYPDDALPATESIAADTQETKQIGTVTTNGGNLNVRTGAGLDNTAFTQLPNGTVVDVIGRDGDWVKILLPARVGYVYGSYLTVTDAADSTVSIGGITLPFDEKELADLWQFLVTSFPVPALERGRHFKNDRRSVPFIKRIGGEDGGTGEGTPFLR